MERRNGVEDELIRSLRTQVHARVVGVVGEGPRAAQVVVGGQFEAVDALLGLGRRRVDDFWAARRVIGAGEALGRGGRNAAARRVRKLAQRLQARVDFRFDRTAPVNGMTTKRPAIALMSNG